MDREILILIAGSCQIVPAMLFPHFVQQGKLKLADGSLELLFLAHAAFLNLVVGITLGMTIRRYPEAFEMISAIAILSAIVLLAFSLIKFFTSGSRIALGGILLGATELASLFAATYF